MRHVIPLVALLFSCQPTEALKTPSPEAASTSAPSSEGHASSTPKKETPASEPVTTHLAPEDEQMFLTIAAGYQKWGRVDERPNIAPMLCRAPRPNDYGKAAEVRFSAAADKSPHGKKLYYLYAKDKSAYLGDMAPTVEQAIVKQSWTSRLGNASQPIASIDLMGPPPPKTSITTEEGTFSIDTQADLFIMAYVGADKPGTDEGWWYATVTPDGKTVTASGKISSCMGCHTKAPHGRLFGLKTK